MSRNYMVEQLLVIRHRDGSVTLKMATEEEARQASVVGTFSLRLGGCRLRVVPAPENFAKIADTKGQEQ